MLKLDLKIIFIPLTAILFCLIGCAHLKPSEILAEELRGIWLSRFEYCRATTTYNQDTIRNFIGDIIQNAARANFNTIFFQVRGNGDAYYYSNLEPWGELLTGKLGEDPGWDPLEFAIETAHEYGLELHAWINTFPVWRGPEPPIESKPRSPYLAHPDWLVCDSLGEPMPLSDHYVSFSPGNPAVHDYINRVVMDVVDRYDVDGIHFDYIRYPEQAPSRGYSHDSVSVSRFNSIASNPSDLDWEDWQRQQLTHFVAGIYNQITSAKSWVKVSAAVLGSYNSGGWNAYHSVYQDPRRWTELGKLDFIVPMIYHPRSHPTAPFKQRAIDYKEHYSVDRLVFPGIGSYRYTTNRRPLTWRETEGQVRFLRKAGFSGMVFFSAGSMAGHWEGMKTKYFTTPAAPPPMSWKYSALPAPPQNVAFVQDELILSITWDDTVNYKYIDSYRIFITDSTTQTELVISVPSGTGNRWIVQRNMVPGTGMIRLSTLDQRGRESVKSTPINYRAQLE